MLTKRYACLAVAAFTVTAVAIPSLAAAQTPTTKLVSGNAAGRFGNGASAEPSLSADGRYAAFSSNASNLVAGDTNKKADIFVRDLKTGHVVRVSVGAGGVQANGRSNQPRLSGDGHFVVFTSEASNLVTGDTNHQPDVFIRDLRTGVTRLVSVGRGGARANWDSAEPVVSYSGRYVAFASDATNLVAGDTNATSDVFVRDMTSGLTTRVSKRTNGLQSDAYSDLPSISADGRYVAFESSATNLIAGDTNGFVDVFLRDRVAGTTRRISLGAGGVQADGNVTQPVISANGKFVAFVSEAANLVATDTDTDGDVVRRTIATGVNVRISFRTDNLQGSFATGPAISGDGNLVAFTTSSDLVPADTNQNQDVYVRNVRAATYQLISVDLSGGGAGLDSANAAISAQGHRRRLHLVGGDAGNRGYE